LAREKMAYLKSLDLGERVAVVLNRVSKKPLFTRQQVEEVLGMPVMRTVSNDYLAVNRAMTEGRCVDPGSELGKQFAEFGGQLLDLKQAPPHQKKSRFLEFFSVGNSLPAPAPK